MNSINKTISSKPMRESNIELLRIFAACAVVILHYNNPVFGGAVEYTHGLSRGMLIFFEALSVGAVDIFVMISGYFMCKSNKRTLLKPLELIIQVILFKEAMYIGYVILGKAEFSLGGVGMNLIPNNWFIILYITLYFISPFLNILWEEAKKRKAGPYLVVVCGILFSLIPTVMETVQELTGYDLSLMSTIGINGSMMGYSIINFSLVYLIGAYLRDSDRRGSILRVCLYLIILVVWAYGEMKMGTQFIYMRCWYYCNPIIILLAAELLLVFRGFNAGSKRWINSLAGASFTVYLMHEGFILFLRNENMGEWNIATVFLHLIASVVGIYLICYLVWLVYEFIMSRIYKATLAKTFLNNNIYKRLDGKDTRHE